MFEQLQGLGHALHALLSDEIMGSKHVCLPVKSPVNLKAHKLSRKLNRTGLVLLEVSYRATRPT